MVNILISWGGSFAEGTLNSHGLIVGGFRKFYLLDPGTLLRAQLWEFDLEWLPTFARTYDDSKPCNISSEHGTLRCDLVK